MKSFSPCTAPELYKIDRTRWYFDSGDLEFADDPTYLPNPAKHGCQQFGYNSRFASVSPATCLGGIQGKDHWMQAGSCKAGRETG